MQPTNGNIYVDGINIFENIKNWQSQIGYVPQNIYLSDDTIKKNIAFALPEEEIDTIAVNKETGYNGALLYTRVKAKTYVK